MNSRQVNIEQQVSDWQEGFDEDYVTKMDANSLKCETEKRNQARMKIEALREKKQLDEYLYDVFVDSDLLN